MLGIVIVSYRSDDRTVMFIKKELSKIVIPHLTVVVDNGASPAEAENLQARLGSLATVLPSENGGFAKGNNKGARWLYEHGQFDYILFTNNDIRIESGDVVQNLLHCFHVHPDVGIAGPEIVGLDGERQSPTPYRGLWERYVWMYYCTPFLSKEAKRKRFQLNYANEADEGYHYSLMGSFMLVAVAAFREVGGFDEGTFLYAEEPILSERFHSIGKKCWFCPTVRVVHEHGVTVTRHFSSKTAAMLDFDSNAYYYQKYKGYNRLSSSVARLLYRMILSVK